MDKNKQLFIKIRILDDMSWDIAVFGENQGIEKLTERVDLSCGAVPPGEYEQVIDLSAPQQFLDLYEHIVEHRFAFVVTAMLKLRPDYIKPLKNYCFEKGKSLGPVECVDDFIIQKNMDEFWNRVDGNAEVYNQLMDAFAQGLKATR